MTQNQKPPTYMFVIRNPGASACPTEPTPEQMQQSFEKWMSWIAGMKSKSQYLAGDPLEEVGRVLRGPRGGSVTDGPFAEAKEVVSGYMLIKADSLGHAATIAKDCPIYDETGGSVEIRQIRLIPM